MKYIPYFLSAWLLLGLWACNEEESIGPNPSQQQDIPVIDAQIEAFLQQWEYSGATLAISKHGKLVYAKAYGLADVEAEQAMTNAHRMRIASISKTFTGIAVLRLVQQGRLQLDDKVFGEDGILGNEFGTKTYTDWLEKVTVRHLLHMTSGGWVLANDRDAIDSQPNLDNRAYFNWMLDNTVLRHEPGTRYWYINTNYFVAARVVEKVSGKPFFQFMKDDFLDDLGIRSATMAKRHLADRQSNEVKYYGLGNIKGFEYGFNIERRDGDAGLVISAVDLLKFVLAINGGGEKPQLLTPALQEAFLQGSGPSPLNNSFGLGIVRQPNGISFTGALPGTRTTFRTNQQTGLAVALLFNGCVDYTNATLWNTFNQAFTTLTSDLVSKNAEVYQVIDQF